MDETPDKGPIKFLEKHIIKYDRKYNLEIIATDFPNIDKWVANKDIDNELSNEYWTNKHITDSQKTCLLKLRHGQYIDNARKQLFFGRETYPSITCSICNSLEPDTWLHVLLNCRQSHIHALQIKRYNKAVWALRKLIVSSKHSRCYIHMNVGARATTYTPSIKNLEEKFKIPKETIRQTFIDINTIAIQHAIFIIVRAQFNKKIEGNP